jgi:SAM-dependent methyltransferase
MVAKLFHGRMPRPDESLLDPGCGTGAFIQGVLRWCEARGHPLPRIVGIESNPDHLEEAKRSLAQFTSVTLLHEDFLKPRSERFDYIIGNPPYVPITGLTVEERQSYRTRYRTANGRFDLYLLFFEEALRLLKPDGRIVFITPEKFLYVQTAVALRKQLAERFVEEVQLVDESTFERLTTYPTVTTVSNSSPTGNTRIQMRDGSTRSVRLPRGGGSWLPLLNGNSVSESAYSLADACVRISCGVATGADSVYILKTSELPAPLRAFAFPTLSGREISVGSGLTASSHSILIPYSRDGTLMPETELGVLGDYLREPARRSQLMRRTCVLRKPWYAFHENPPLTEILGPKILCKDIGVRPYFVVDEEGTIVPRHSVYYLVPADVPAIHHLCRYLNSDRATRWLLDHCQRAANGFVRLQSHVLKLMPVPAELAAVSQTACV